MIVPTIYVPTEIPATRDHSGRRPAFVPEAKTQTLDGPQGAHQRGTDDSSEDVKDLGGGTGPEVIAVGIDEGAPVDEGIRWPDETSETAFLTEQLTQGSMAEAGKTSQKVAPEALRAPLPPLRDLIERIPPEAREVLEDLFRARFVNVRYTETGE